MSGVDEDEWTIEGFIADIDAMHANPPAAPEGMERVECAAEPPCWPTYVAHVDGMYPAPCMYCVSARQTEQLDRLRCQREHRRWKSWNIWSRLASRLYTLGITSSGGGTSFGRCKFCGIGRQYMAPHWRGKRSYILGLERETWTCWLRGHRRVRLNGSSICVVCMPCPSCGSTEPAHSGDCGGA